MSKKRRIDTDNIRQTTELREQFAAQCTPQDGHLIFRSENGRHMKVATRAQDGDSIVSVRRLAFALAHPETHVRQDEEVFVTCGISGHCDTGDGCCVLPEHLVKLPARGTAPKPRNLQVLHQRFKEQAVAHAA